MRSERIRAKPRLSWARGAAIVAVWISGSIGALAEPDPGAGRAAGQTLREALDAVKTEEPDAAQERLAALARLEPDLRDLIAWAEAQAWHERGEAARAQAAVLRGLEARPTPPIAARLHQLDGILAAERGDEAGARAGWERALASARDRSLRTELRMALASSWERSERPERAVERYREVWLRDPASPAAGEADARLEALEALEGVPPRTSQDFVERGDGLYQRRHSEAALRAYERALAGSLPASERVRVAERRAHCLFRLRRYPEAAAAFGNLSGPAAKLWKGRSLARSNRVEDAIDLLDEVSRETGGTLAARSRYLAGLLHAGRDREGPARRQFEAVVAAGVGGELERDARWRLAWADFNAGRFEPARSGFRVLSEAYDHPIDQLQPRYWAARAAEPNAPDTARLELSAIAREFPLSYYGWQAGRRLDEPAATPLPNQVRSKPAQLDARTVYRAEAMIAAGLTEAGRVHLVELRNGARNLRDYIEVAELYAAADDYYHSLRTVVDPYRITLARGVAPDLESLWRVAWPRPWDDLVRGAASPELEPEVVWSVMREESAYRPDVVSVTGALGLLQIMPETGERLAQQSGLTEFSTQSLLLPEINVRLGSFYLWQLGRQFQGQLPAAIASYNAGPHVVSRWLRDGDHTDDEWIESIPYSQTRAYVKRVLRSLTAYRAIYGG